MITALTANVDPQFDKAFPAACMQIGCEPIDLLGMIMSESAGNPAAHNQGPAKVLDKVTGVYRPSLPAERYNAVGLIQFMPATLLGLGWRNGYEAFKHLSATQQLPYVIAYFNQWRKTGAPWDSAGRLYQACFVPGTLSSSSKPEDILVAKGGRLGWAYEANMVFDRNGDGAITIGELTDAIKRNATGPRWLELLERLGLNEGDEGKVRHYLAELDDDDALSHVLECDGDELDTYLRTVRGTQVALERLGFDVGPKGIDGYFGGDTRQAVIRFQRDRELAVDGIVGSETRSALGIALRTAA